MDFEIIARFLWAAKKREFIIALHLTYPLSLRPFIILFGGADLAFGMPDQPLDIGPVEKIAITPSKSAVPMAQ